MSLKDILKNQWDEIVDEAGKIKASFKKTPLIQDLAITFPIAAALYFGLYQDYSKDVERTPTRTVKIKPAKMSGNTIKNVLQWQEMIQDIAEDPHQAAVFSSIIATESKGIVNAVSPSGCKGLTQICGDSGNKVEVQDYDKFGGECELYDGKCFAVVKQGRNVIVDNRMEPYVALKAGWKIYQGKRSAIRNCSPGAEEMDRTMMILAAYNGGEGLVCDAARKSGENPVKWADVYKQTNSQHIKKHLGKYKYFKNRPDRIRGKVREVRRYPYSVLKRYPVFKRAFSPKVASKD